MGDVGRGLRLGLIRVVLCGAVPTLVVYADRETDRQRETERDGER